MKRMYSPTTEIFGTSTIKAYHFVICSNWPTPIIVYMPCHWIMTLLKMKTLEYNSVIKVGLGE